MVRAKTKTEVAAIKLTQECQRAWEAAAASERRSLANMFEVAILDYCQRHSIEVPAIEPATTPVPLRKACRQEGGEMRDLVLQDASLAPLHRGTI